MKNTEEMIREILIAITNRAIGADKNADLYEDLGLASAHAVSLLTDLEQRFRVHILDDDFIEARSIVQLTSMVDAILEHE
jgi:acyl carrier protein